jgi:hypothetical protein
MSQETPLNKLGGGSMNQEDSQLVDSILNDLNSGGSNQGQQGMGQQGMGQQGMGQQGMGQQGMGQQGMTEEQHRMMLAQRQQEMMEQQAMMQQALKMNENESILDSLQAEWKSILLIIVLSVFMNTGFIEGIFKSNENTYFVLEDGSLNIQAHIVKAFIIGGIFFLAKKYM